jgi:hypothetical protein
VVKEIHARFGRLLLHEHGVPPVLWIEAHGFITPFLVRADLEHAAAFGQQHPEGWSYVVDIGGVRGVHPLNPWLLRGIRRLPYLDRYVVVAPGRAARLGVLLATPLVRPDAVLRTVGEARELCGLDSGTSAPRD